MSKILYFLVFLLISLVFSNSAFACKPCEDVIFSATTVCTSSQAVFESEALNSILQNDLNMSPAEQTVSLGQSCGSVSLEAYQNCKQAKTQCEKVCQGSENCNAAKVLCLETFDSFLDPLKLQAVACGNVIDESLETQSQVQSEETIQMSGPTLVTAYSAQQPSGQSTEVQISEKLLSCLDQDRITSDVCYDTLNDHCLEQPNQKLCRNFCDARENAADACQLLVVEEVPKEQSVPESTQQPELPEVVHVPLAHLVDGFLSGLTLNSPKTEMFANVTLIIKKYCRQNKISNCED